MCKQIFASQAVLTAVPPPVKLPLFSAGVQPRLAVRNSLAAGKKDSKGHILVALLQERRQKPALAMALLQSDLWKDI